ATQLQHQLQATLGDSYDIERELPPGGMSRLFLATERALDRKVVVKLLPPEFASELNAQRFQREMLVTAKLLHPHILPVLSAGARDGLLYYVTPWVTGESLWHRIERDGALVVDEAVRLLREVTAALSFAHQQGVIHRDLKPGNILLQHGHVLLADFGIARALEKASRDTPAERLTTTSPGLGTPGYMAPEQLAGDSDVDERADLYALGIVAYEMLTGQGPFAGLPPARLFIAQMTQDPQPLTSVNPTVPEQLSAVVARCLRREPGDRWPSAEQVLAQLNELALEQQMSRSPRSPTASAADETIRQGLAAFKAGDWLTAFDALTAADAKGELAPEHLELLADAAWWLGRGDDAVRTRERAYTRHVERGNRRRAAAVAIALAEDYHYRLSRAVSHGWLQRAARHLADLPESIEHGWLARTRMSLAFDEDRGLDRARELVQQALEIARRQQDRDLIALTMQDQGRILVAEGRVAEGMALIDEAMAAATSGQLDARTTGRTYCNMMSTCEKLGDYRRAGEWNEVARQWCEPHADSGGYPGICRVHRAELLKLRGAWTEAEAEARRASVELQGFLGDVAAEANYELGEVRLRMGDFQTAEQMFRRAHEMGRDPLPGLAMLRLNQGRADSAKALLDRALAEPGMSRLDRARLLPSHVAAAIATGAIDVARASAQELESIADMYGTTALAAATASARGAVELAEQRPAEAAVQLRRAWKLWKEIDLPYEAARVRVLLGKAYQASGNTDDAVLELEAAATSFERLGAAADARQTAVLLGG
ncbi:MAG TPA: protein kinase, partial [Gemmatimonadaceae bacterium]|nr:protein kinase [Gemmatimonadaceae bacterium]